MRFPDVLRGRAMARSGRRIGRVGQNPRMNLRWRDRVPWWLAWAVLVLAGGAAMVRWDIAQRREAFATDARIVHRLLSQRAAGIEAVLGTLSLLDPARADPGDAPPPLSALYPPVLQVLRRVGDRPWPDAGLDAALRAAEPQALRAGHAVVATVDAAAQRVVLLRAGAEVSHALVVDVQRLVPWDDWPLDREGPVRVLLRLGDADMTLQPGAPAAAQPAGLTPGFVTTKVLDSPALPFEVLVQRATGPAQWPWALLAGWAVAAGVLLAALAAWRQQRSARRRAEELLRLGQLARLNTLGEMAAGLAHELNQPLAAVLANAQAARRRLEAVDATVGMGQDPASADEDLVEARDAIAQVVAQARRASDVVQRMRRRVEPRAGAAALQPVALDAVVREALHLMQPQTHRAGVQVSLDAEAALVSADAVALEQIVHNLLLNALQALADVPAGSRRLDVRVAAEGTHGVLTVADSGPGIAPEMLPRLFQPFATTKAGGLGLGLSLSETLAAGMGGSLGARNRDGRGAEFRLALPLAATGTQA
jgi:signal transduction histidine kinase